MIEPYYHEDGITIYNANCMAIYKEVPNIDLVLTDPPYKFTTSGGGLAKKRGYEKALSGLGEGFDMEILRHFSNWFCFCSKDQLIELLMLARDAGRWMLLTWNKPDPTPLMNGNYLPDTEYIVHKFTKLYGSYEHRSRFTIMPGGSKDFHPTGKPVQLIKRLIIVGSDSRHTILDPFMGSGTMLVAAKQLGRKAVGIEISEKYCEIAVKRLSQMQLEFK